MQLLGMRQQSLEHHFRLGHEEPVAASQVTITDIAEDLHPGIHRIRHQMGSVHGLELELGI